MSWEWNRHTNTFNHIVGSVLNIVHSIRSRIIMYKNVVVVVVVICYIFPSFNLLNYPFGWAFAVLLSVERIYTHLYRISIGWFCSHVLRNARLRCVYERYIHMYASKPIYTHARWTLASIPIPCAHSLFIFEISWNWTVDKCTSVTLLHSKAVSVTGHLARTCVRIFVHSYEIQRNFFLFVNRYHLSLLFLYLPSNLVESIRILPSLCMFLIYFCSIEFCL